jgi:uncharacterized membrane protein YdbT with pleckstrin-like domain
MLQQDEIVLLLVKPSLWFILVTSLRFVTAMTLLGILAVNVFSRQAGSFITPQTAATAAVVVAVGRLIWGVCVWSSHTYLLTNLRILTIKGVVNVAIYQASLRKIQRTTVYRRWWERALGLGTLGFATAAAGGPTESTWQMIPRPLATHQQVLAAIQKASGNGGV